METTDERAKRWFLYGMNKEEIIAHWEAKMQVANAKMQALEAELKASQAKLKDLELRQAPTFITQSTFLTKR